MLLTITEFLKHLFENPSDFFNPDALIRYGGLLVVFIMVYCETGLFFCFFFSGDALIFSAGVLFGTESYHHPLHVIIMTLASAAILGNLTGYAFGRSAGPMLLKRNTFFFKQKYMEAAREYYDRYGVWAITGGLFLPIIRTFSPILAGVLHIDARKFLLFAIIGSLVWIGSLSSAGYFLGEIPFVKKNLHLIALAMILTITIPVIIQLVRRVRKIKQPKDE